VLAQFKDDSHTVQSLRKNLGNIFRLGLLDLPAWLSKSIQELKVVLGLFPANLDLVLEGLKLLQVRAVGCAQDLDDLFEILQLKSLD